VLALKQSLHKLPEREDKVEPRKGAAYGAMRVDPVTALRYE
jgi:hypothetical protein